MRDGHGELPVKQPAAKKKKKVPSERQLQIADRMRKEMLRSGLNQEEIAQRVGVEPPAVSRWLDGSNEPNADRMAAYAAAVECPESYLWTGEYPMTEKDVKTGVVLCLLGIFKGRSMRTTFEKMTAGPYQAGGPELEDQILQLEMADPYAYHIFTTLIPDWRSLSDAELAQRLQRFAEQGRPLRR